MDAKTQKNSVFSKALFKQSCKANGTMWGIITFAVCFMLACVMLISGGGNISQVKNSIEDTIIVKEIDGVKCEPFEDLQIDVSNDYVGGVIESLGLRFATLDNMQNMGDQTRLTYVIPSRGLIGFMTEFMTITKGYGIMNHTFKEYRPVVHNQVGERKLGVLVSMENGKATAYALGQLEERGTMFVEPGDEVYEGMIVGEHNHDNDIAVNVVKGKNLTNTRASGSDHTVVLKRPRVMSLEIALDYINNDELVEVTPLGFRLRKKILKAELRKKANNQDLH